MTKIIDREVVKELVKEAMLKKLAGYLMASEILEKR
jgi:hypothetical protein